MSRLVSIVIASAFSASIVFADDPKSGLEVGKPAPGFEVQVATGDDAGKAVDYLKQWDGKPVLIVFVGEMTRPAFSLLRQLDKYGRLRQPDALEVLLVRVTDDADVAVRQSKLYYDSYDVKSPAGVIAEGRGGAKEYGLNADAQMTVLLLDKNHKVSLNVARRAPDRKDFDEIRKGIDKLIGPSPVPFP